MKRSLKEWEVTVRRPGQPVERFPVWTLTAKAAVEAVCLSEGCSDDECSVRWVST